MLALFRFLSIVRQVTPAFRATIRAVLDDIAAQAKKTPGTADDEATALLIELAKLAGLY